MLGTALLPWPPGGRGLTRTFTAKEVSSYDWQVGVGSGCQRWGVFETLGLEPGFIFTCVHHGAAHSVATGSQESIPRQAVGAAHPPPPRTCLGNWRRVASALFPRSKHLQRPPVLKGRGPRPHLFAEECRTICSIFKPPLRSFPLFLFLFSTSSSSSYFSSTVTRMYGIMCLDQALCSEFQQHVKDGGPSHLSTRSPMSSVLRRRSESVAT